MIQGNGEEKWMRRAIELAWRGAGRTRPNPPVGAVLVLGRRVVGEGYHRKAGGPHAEIAALSMAGALARGATLYVTLEPCSTTGRTGPCTEAILAAGVKAVVVGTRDPNPRHAGRGIRLLRRRGIPVSEGLLGGECCALIAPFRKWILTGRPYVTLKLAVSLDGRIADRGGCSKWITGPEARAEVQRMRHRADAVMVGSGTVLADDPSLLCRACATPHGWRVVMDSRGRVPAGARVLSDASADRTVLATLAGSAASRAAAQRRCETWELPRAAGHVSVRALLRRLGRRGLLHVLCEGGGGAAHALIRAGVVDEFVFFIAPLVLGGDACRAAVSGAGWPLPAAPRLRIVECRRVGADVMIRAVPGGV